MSVTIHGQWNEDGSATIYGRVTAQDATGTAVQDEGKCLKQADLSAVTYYVHDLTSDVQVIASAGLTIANVIFDTLQKGSDDSVWGTHDDIGFNFRTPIPLTAFPTGDHEYEVELKYTTTGGTVGYGWWRGKARPTRQS